MVQGTRKFCRHTVPTPASGPLVFNCSLETEASAENETMGGLPKSTPSVYVHTCVLHTLAHVCTHAPTARPSTLG